MKQGKRIGHLRLCASVVYFFKCLTTNLCTFLCFFKAVSKCQHLKTLKRAGDVMLRQKKERRNCGRLEAFFSHVHFFEQKFSLHSLYFSQNMLMLYDSSTSHLHAFGFISSFCCGDGAEASQHGHPAEVSGSPEGSLQPRKKLIVTLATRSGVTQIVIFLTH